MGKYLIHAIFAVFPAALCGCATAGDSGNDVLECPVGEAPCSGSCVDLFSDHANCGSCGNECALQETCIGGLCTLECPPDAEICSNQCVDLDSDHDNCGSCGRACGADEVCNSGDCESECGTGLQDCDGSCVYLLMNPFHCGECGNACDPDEMCIAGECRAGCGDGMCNGEQGEDTCTCPDDCGESNCTPGTTRETDIPDCGVKTEICTPTCAWEKVTEEQDDDKCPLEYEFCRHTYECCLSLSALLGDHTIHVQYEPSQPECSLAGLAFDLPVTFSELRGNEEDGMLEGTGETFGETWVLILTRTGCYDFDVRLYGGENNVEASVTFTDDETMSGTGVGHFAEEWNPLGGDCYMLFSGW